MNKKSIIIVLFLICTVLQAGDKKLRVVSLSPSLTETIYRLGKGDLLVGRSLVCNYPKEAKKLRVAGNFNRPNIERLAVMMPDYVVCTDFQDPAAIRKLRSIGMKVVLLRDKSIDSYFSCISELGKILNCREKAAKEIKRIKTGLAEFKKKAAEIPLKKRPKVFFMLWDSPVMSIGKKSFLTDYIDYAGGRSITAKVAQGYFSSSLEFVLAENPDLMICPSMHVNKAKEFVVRPGWKDIKAVKKGRVYSGLNPDLMFRMSPRMLESIQIIRDCIFPKKNKETKKR